METQITIYRGTHQIGGCITEIQVGTNRILIDFGANLPGNEAINVLSDEEIVKAVFQRDNSKAKCVAVLFTHYHGDHYGLYKKVPPKIPMYIGYTAKKILEILMERLDYFSEDKGLPVVKKMKTYQINKWKKLAEGIEILPLVVDHSALDSYMFVIRAGKKRILFTGDFRDHGITGGEERFEKMLDAYVGDVDILITEGTMLSRLEEASKNPIQTEENLGKRAGEIFNQYHENVVLVSSTNLDSIMEFYYATPADKEFVCDAYQAKIILTAIEDKQKYYEKYRLHQRYPNVPRNFCIIGNMEGLGGKQNCYPANWDLLRERGYVLLARPNRNPDKTYKNRFEEAMKEAVNPHIIYSMWAGYLEEEHADADILRFLDGYREDMDILHTSGHAYKETIQKLMDKTHPKMIIPMHTQCADTFHKFFPGYEDKVNVLKDGEGYKL